MTKSVKKTLNGCVIRKVMGLKDVGNPVVLIVVAACPGVPSVECGPPIVVRTGERVSVAKKQIKKYANKSSWKTL